MKTNTKIYTREFILDEMKSLLTAIRDDKGIIYLGELFLNKEYSRSRFHEWVREYEEDEEIYGISCTIKEILETRAVKGALTSDLNSTMTIFHLKNNYNWKDKTEVEQKTEMKMSFADLSDEELEKLISE